nr:hypothetical protein [Hyphomonas sp. BRH_c22]
MGASLIRLPVFMAVADAGNNHLISHNVEDDDVGIEAVNAHGPIEFIAQADRLGKVSNKAQFLAVLFKVAAGLLLTE